VLNFLQAGGLTHAVAVVDDVLLRRGMGMTGADPVTLRRAHAALSNRRTTRSKRAA
jgi:hypothetical protein